MTDPTDLQDPANPGDPTDPTDPADPLDPDDPLGTGGFFENTEAEGWQLSYRRHTVDWFIALAEDPAFMALLSARWKELCMGELSDASLLARWDAMAAPLAAAAARDFERWPPSGINMQLFEVPAGETWEAQLQVVRDWIPARTAWLDTAVDSPIDVPEYP